MSRITRTGKWFIGVGLIVGVVGSLLQPGPSGPGMVGQLSSVVFTGIALIGNLTLSLGVLLFLGGIAFPRIRGTNTFERQDIIEPTNWSRTSQYILRRSFGVPLVVASIVMLLLSVAVNEGFLTLVWLGALLLGVVWVFVSWRSAAEIVDHETSAVSVQLPEQFTVHQFHIALRQKAEDLGYVIDQDTSPGQGGKAASYNDRTYHANGGFKARKRPVRSSRILAPEADGDPYLSKIATVASLGVFSLSLGVLLLGVASDPLAGLFGPGDIDPAFISGLLLSIAGLGILAYDYLTRTREWAEIYCVAEGTITASTKQLYDDDVLNSQSDHTEPTVTAPDTGAELSITLGARRTSLYPEDDLLDDLDEIAAEIERSADDHSDTVMGD